MKTFTYYCRTSVLLATLLFGSQSAWAQTEPGLAWDHRQGLGTPALASTTPPGMRVVAWGRNSYGQTTIPTSATGPMVIAAGGNQSLALRSNGTMVAWGVLSDVAPQNLGGLAGLAAGSMHAVALRANGTVQAWGDNLNGQLNIPGGLGGVRTLVAGANHTLALRSNGTVAAWGLNRQSQCNVPAGLSNVLMTAAGNWHSLALLSNGTVLAWGDSGVPPGLTNILAIAAGGSHSLALRADGTVVSWGINGFGGTWVPNMGQCDVPAGLSNVVALAGGTSHSLALRADGSVVAWGDNRWGQSNVPADLTNAVAIAAGEGHTLAVVGNGGPVITVAPLGQVVYRGSPATLQALVVGAVPLSFQWQKEESDLPGATNSMLAFTATRAADAGAYRVVISNPFGQVVSQPAPLTVIALPALSAIADQVGAVDVSVGPLAFIVSDEELPAEELQVSASAAPPGLISSLLLSGTGTNRAIQIIPAPGQAGTSTITLSVRNHFFTVSNQFHVSFLPMPLLSVVPEQTVVQGMSTGPIPFTIADPDTPLDAVTVQASGDPPGFLSGFTLSGSGAQRSVAVVAAADRFGWGTVSLTANDGTHATTSNFVIRVLARPVLGVIPDQTIRQGTMAGPIALSITDPDTPWSEWRVTAISDHPLLVPQTNLQVVASEGQFSLRITPVSEYSGSAHITVAVSDGTASTARTFTLQVMPRMDSPMLRVTAVEGPTNPPLQRLRFLFADGGTGATNYALEYLPDFSGTHVWSNASTVQITDLGGGRFQADVNPPPEDSGFYRLKGFRSVVANFNSAGLQVDEGTGVAYLAVLFNGPCQGNVRYTVSGTAGTNDVGALSGVVAVNGNTAAIPIVLRDDDNIGPQRYLTLTLEADPAAAYRLGAISAHTLTIEENDAAWQGQLLLDHGIMESVTGAIVYTNNASSRVTNTTTIPLQGQAVIDFVLTLRQSGGRFQGALRSDQFGLFPTNDTPAVITSTAELFSARMNGIPLPADSTFLGVPVQLQLQLTARAGQTNQAVTPTELRGDAAVVMHLEGLPHLDTTNSGRFFLMKPPTAPGTNEVKLVNER